MSQLSGVEVRSSVGGWAPEAQIVDYNPEDKQVTVIFNEDVFRKQDVALENVRFVEELESELAVNEGDPVEVFYQPHSDQPGLWHTGVLDKSKGGFYKCKFNSGSTEISDVFEVAHIRKPNLSPCLSAEDFFKCDVVIPDELQSYCDETPDAHRDFAKACEAMGVRYLDGRLIILSRKDVSRRVDMIQEFHIKNLLQKMRLAERVTVAQKTLEQSKLVAESCCEKFQVEPDLLKFVVGSKGVNIQKARAIPGVIQINIEDEKQTVHIYAETSESAKNARLLLEYTEEFYLVPRNLVGRIIGQKGKSIQDIIDKSHVLKVRVLSEDDAKTIPGAESANVCAFKFIGTRINNQNAVVLMDYLVQSLKEIDVLQDEQQEIEKQIKTYHPFGTTYSYNNGNSTSGYCSEKEPSHRNRRNRNNTKVDTRAEGDGVNSQRKQNNKKTKPKRQQEQNRIQNNKEDQQDHDESESFPISADGWNTVQVRGPYARAAAGTPAKSN